MAVATPNAAASSSNPTASNATASVPDVGAVQSSSSVHQILYVGLRLSNFDKVHSTTHYAGKLTGMKPSQIAYNTKKSFGPEEAMQLFGYSHTNLGRFPTSRVPRRFQFYCTVKGCPWHVPWTWDRNVFKVIQSVTEYGKTVPFCIDHSHQTTEITVDGYAFINHVNDLTHDEKTFIANNAFVPQGIPSLKIAMGKKFQKYRRDYCDKLISRVRKSALDEYYGGDRDQLQKLRDDGVAMREGGGVWIEDIDDAWTLCGTFRQNSVQRQSALEYGCYYQTADGTHGTNKYKLTAFVHTGIDCLGMSVILGLTTMRAENGGDATRSCVAYGLSNLPEQYKDKSHGCVSYARTLPSTSFLTVF